MLEHVISLRAEVREGAGKNANRRVRAGGLLPAVVYGDGVENATIAVSPKELTTALSNPYIFNSVFRLEREGQEPVLCMIKERQFDSVRRVLTHVDFLAVSPERFVTIDVPVDPQGKSEGEKLGGRLVVVSRSVKLRCRVKDIPVSVPHDVSPLRVSESVYVDEMTAPAGCELVYKNRFPVIRVARKRGAKVQADSDSDS